MYILCQQFLSFELSKYLFSNYRQVCKLLEFHHPMDQHFQMSIIMVTKDINIVNKNQSMLPFSN